MTALDFAAAGITFTSSGGAYTIRGPRDRRDLMGELLAEVERRMSAMREPRKLADHTPDTCETCGDRMAPGRGGWCALCVLARRRTLVASGRLPS